MMKAIATWLLSTFTGLAIALSAIAGEDKAGLREFDYILKKYVHGEYVDYAGLSKNKKDLDRLDHFLDWQANAKVKSMPRAGQIAFYINAYNACCIKVIVDNYPVHSPKDVDGFFDKIKFKVAGEDLTIAQIEYDRLIDDYKDMRAHFAVVCADRGCLPLKNEAYTAENVDKHLEAAARQFVRDERQFKIDPKKKEIHVSKVFEWYGPKFTKDPKRPAEKPELYLKYWADEDARRLLESGKYELRIIEWDWTLNEKLGKVKSKGK